MDLRVLAVAAKDVRLLTRDSFALMTLLAMPVVFIVILSFALGPVFEGEGIEFDLPLIDRDRTENSRRLVELLDGIDGITVEPLAPDDESAIRDEVRKGNELVALVIPEGFGAQLDAGQPTRLQLLVDPAESAGPSIVRGIVLGTALLLAAEGQTLGLVRTIFEQVPLAPGADSDALQRQIEAQVTQQIRTGGALESVDVVQEVAGAEEDDIPSVHEQNVPGYTVLGVFFLVTALSTSILVERREGTFRRLLASPIRRSHILLGKLLAYFLVGLAQITLLFAFGVIVFGMGLGDSPLGIVVISVALVLAATGLGVFIATVAQTEQRAGGLGTLLVLALSALGGSMVPRFVMPEWMQTIGLFTPQAWAIDGFQDVIVRSATVADVLPHAGVLLAFAAFFFLLGVFRFTFD